ncbi:Uma2 family endonuclease [Streptacidiphilus fuscans]|uniref:Uma2 family endonuclease n=1 Tax=Streptacidiphilus fuscans TaxID=2789292 RepID=A0A931B5N9_9ACTN|nr:Uma2 family endonuclease [Streptacidiphilus fuscans]MBF9071680.1 Uma2 family endonuclease [Streptacidiphilus fuscans]
MTDNRPQPAPEELARLRAVADELAEVADRQQEHWKVEITDGQVTVMMMSPSGQHGVNVLRLRRQIEQQDAGVAAFSDTDTEDPVSGLRKVPDLMIVPESEVDAVGARVSSRVVLLAAEVVSPSNPRNDLEVKARDYPAMGIPVYMIVDPRKGDGMVYSESSQGPDGICYRKAVPYTFGDRIVVGPWTVDTSGFRMYQD